MLMQRYSPSLSMWDRPLSGLNLFDDVFENFFNLARSTSTGPRFITHETDDGYMVAAEVPGMKKEDIRITVQDGILAITGERTLECPEGYQVLRRERMPARFSRSLTLTDRMIGENIEAKVENGVLKIAIPLRPEAKPRQIPVSCS